MGVDYAGRKPENLKKFLWCGN